MTRAPAASAYLQQLLAISTFSSLPWLHRIRCPALVMGGDDDPLIRSLNLRVIKALLPDARLHMVRGGGHLFMILRPEETAREVAAFLGKRRLSPAA
jgi:poly(3-hydroxyoctanoate) depolymerase